MESMPESTLENMPENMRQEYLCAAAQTPPSKLFILNMLNAKTNSIGSKKNVVDYIGDTAGTLVTWVHIARRWWLDTSPARHSSDRSCL